MPLGALGPIEIQPARRTIDEPLFNSLMEHYHYLGYEQPVGEHLKYVLRAQGRPIACLAWSSAPRHLGSRDRFIGWNAEARRHNIRFLAYNTRFLILPWVAVPHLASHIPQSHRAALIAGLGARLWTPHLFSGDHIRLRALLHAAGEQEDFRWLFAHYRQGVGTGRRGPMRRELRIARCDAV